MNARFWIYHNETWSKITLRPGESVEFTGGGRTDEGFSYWAESYEHVGDGIESRSASNASDCDGPLDRYCDCYCPLERISALPAEWNGSNHMPDRPEWHRVSEGQRDYYAERAGY